MEQYQQFFKALSDRNRLRVVAALGVMDELCACHITDLLEVSGATVSNHMSLLLQAGILSSRKDGRWTYYKLEIDCPEFNIVLEWLIKKLAATDQIRSDLKRLKTDICCGS